MAEETRENIMQVELAIQRELAYRKKVAMLHLQPDADSGIDHMPLEPSSLSLCLRSNSSPSPCISGKQRQAPTSSLEFLPPQQAQLNYNIHLLKNHTDNFFCEVCQVPCSCAITYKQHTNGHKHKAKLQELKFGMKDGGDDKHQQAPTSSLEFLPPQQAQLNYNSHLLKNHTDNFFCKVCQVPCSCAITYKKHTNGHKHKAKLQQLKFGMKDGGDDHEIATQRWRCGLCDIWCMNEDCFRQHLGGQKHKDKQRKLELARTAGVSIVKKRKRCELCNIWCIDDFSYKMHIVGKKHSILAMEKMKRGPNKGWLQWQCLTEKKWKMIH